MNKSLPFVIVINAYKQFHAQKEDKNADVRFVHRYVFGVKGSANGIVGLFGVFGDARV